MGTIRPLRLLTVATFVISVLAPVGTVSAAATPHVTLRTAVVAALTAGPPPSGALIDSAVVSGSPFTPNRDGVRERAFLHLTLSRPAIVTITMVDFDGIVRRTFWDAAPREAGTWTRRWNGRDAAGRLVPDGPYRFHVTATDPVDPEAPTETVTRGVAKGPVVYAPASGAITIAISAGHGGHNIGAPYVGADEKDINLDIALRLRDMLESAGVTVVMSRVTDRNVNVPPIDANGDGVMDRSDELTARVDVGNLARADVHLDIHNNSSPCDCGRGTGIFTNRHRTWTPESRALARSVLEAHLDRLQAFRSRTWWPIDRGVQMNWFFVTRPYSLPHVPRPSLQPAILGESLFGDHAVEGPLLQRPDVRTRIAVAYFSGVARWLRTREFGMRYEVDTAPVSAAVGEVIDLQVGLTNTGNTTSDGWTLEARYVPWVARYDGSGTPGTILAAMAIPDGLAPGQSIEVVLDDMPVPDVPGEWLVKLDIAMPDSMAFHGVVSPQIPLTTTGEDEPPTADPPRR